MDHKTWLWRKKSTEKMIVATDKVNLSPNGNEEEVKFVKFWEFVIFHFLYVLVYLFYTAFHLICNLNANYTQLYAY